jgi:hypothetical protein
MYYMQINKNFVHQVGYQSRLYYDARSTNHQDQETNLFACSEQLATGPCAEPDESNHIFIYLKVIK